MSKPPSFTREQIINDLELYEAVGAALDAQALDDAYAQHRLNGLNHYVAKEEAYKQVMGRDYPYGRPGSPSERDEAVFKDKQVFQENKQLKSEQKQARPSNRRMAGLTLAGAGGAAGLIAVIDLLQEYKTPYNSNNKTNLNHG